VGVCRRFVQSLGLAQTAPPPRADAQHVAGRAAGAAGKTWNRGTRGCNRDGDSRWVAEVLLSEPTTPHPPLPNPKPDHPATENNGDRSSVAAAAASACSAPELETRAHDGEVRCE